MTGTKLAFAIEDNVGNATYRKNLAQVIGARADVEPRFLPVQLVDTDIWQLIPAVRSNLALVASARAASALHASRAMYGTDAAFIHSQSIALFALDFMRKTPTLISSDATPANFDGLALGYGHTVHGKRAERAKKAWMATVFKRAAVLLGFSNWVKESYVNDYGIAPEKCVVISSGVDLTRWRPDASRRPNDGVVRVLFIGADWERKGGEVLLKWAKNTSERNFELNIVTKRPVPDTPQVIAHYNMTSNAPELIELAQRCDMFAFPTRADCYPFACIEGAAAGLAGVSFKLGAIHEIVVDGQTGLLAPEGDDAGFCERLDHLVRDETMRKTMALAARERAEQRFDAVKNATEIVEVMKRMAGS